MKSSDIIGKIFEGEAEADNDLDQIEAERSLHANRNRGRNSFREKPAEIVEIRFDYGDDSIGLDLYTTRNPKELALKCRQMLIRELSADKKVTDITPVN